MDRAVRIYVTVAAMTAMLIGPAFSQEAGQQLPAPLTESTVTDSATDSSAYPYKWQRRLLAAQVAFANSLVGTDLIETGAINPQEK